MFSINSKAWQVPDNTSTNPAIREAISHFQYVYLVIKKVHETDFSASWIDNKYVYSDPSVQKAWDIYKNGMLAIRQLSRSN